MFGQINRSQLWAVDGTLSASEGSTQFRIDRNQVICVVKRKGALRIHFSNRAAIDSLGEDLILIRSGKSKPFQIESINNGESCDFLIFGFQLDIARQTFQASESSLGNEVADLLFSSKSDEIILQRELPDLIHERLFSDMRSPPVSGASLDFWFEAKVRELLALGFFQNTATEEPFFCTKQKRLARDRVAAAKEFIAANLDKPFDLKAAATVAGCSPHYLSRTFSESEGKTLMQYLRKVRIDIASELIRSGNYNVSEAALEVGYQSLSHFSKAFQQEKGVLPSRYESQTAEK